MGASATAMPLGEVIVRHLDSGAAPIAPDEVLTAQLAACATAATGAAALRAGARLRRRGPSIPAVVEEVGARVLRSNDRHGLRARRKCDRFASVTPAAQIPNPVAFLAIGATCDQHETHGIRLTPAPCAHESPRAPAPSRGFPSEPVMTVATTGMTWGSDAHRKLTALPSGRGAGANTRCSQS